MFGLVMELMMVVLLVMFCVILVIIVKVVIILNFFCVEVGVVVSRVSVLVSSNDFSGVRCSIGFFVMVWLIF